MNVIAVVSIRGYVLPILRHEFQVVERKRKEKEKRRESVYSTFCKHIHIVIGLNPTLNLEKTIDTFIF